MVSTNNTGAIEELKVIAVEQKSFFEKLFDRLPEKAMSLGVRVILVLVFLIIGRLAINLLRKICRKALEKAGIEKGVVQFLDSFLSIVLWIVLVMTIAVNNGIDAASVVALIGSAGIAVGLSLQGALSNFAGGLLILLLKPFSLGDYIYENASNTEGRVAEINVFYTHLVTVDNKTVIVPNGKLADSSLVNYTRQKTRQIDLRFSIAYESDIRKAKKILERVASSNRHGINGEKVTVFVSSLEDSAVSLGLRVWVRAEDYWVMRWEIIEAVKYAFDEEGISIPFNQLDIHLDPVKE